MTTNEFSGQFKVLQAQYPTFKVPEPELVKKIWFEQLKFYSAKQMSTATRAIAAAGSTYFPSVGELLKFIKAQEENDNAQRYPRINHWPIDHGCGLDGKQIPMSGPRLRLYSLQPYEAVHIKCQGSFSPVCPFCGIKQASFENPFFRKMIELFPHETAGWNPQQKGDMLCDSCDRMRYPIEFTKYKPQEAGPSAAPRLAL